MPTPARMPLNAALSLVLTATITSTFYPQIAKAMRTHTVDDMEGYGGLATPVLPESRIVTPPSPAVSLGAANSSEPIHGGDVRSYGAAIADDTPATAAAQADATEVIGVLDSHSDAMYACYGQELQKHPELAGTVDIGWTITATGGVAQVHIINSTLRSAAVEKCMVAGLSTWRFSPLSIGAVDVHWPYVFSAR